MSAYNFLMESRLSPEQFRATSHLSQLATQQGLNLYLVGGAVRDLTYGQQTIRDLDFAVEGSPQRILRRLETAGSARPSREGSRQEQATSVAVSQLRFDARLNAAEITFANGVRAELAMCRTETYSKAGRKPEVAPAMVFEDLRRRDFSVNAMAVSLHPNSRGLLLDPTNGAADIEKHELRVLHRASFLEDPSRIYRLFRLGLRLDFKAEERTRSWLDSALENRVMEQMDPEQQGRELRAILQESHPGRILKRLLTVRGLLPGLDKKLAASRIPYDRFTRIRSVVSGIPGADTFLLNFHCLVEKLGAAQEARLAKKIIPDSKTRKQALSLERDAKKVARVLGSAKAGLPSQVYALLSPQPQPLLLFLLAYYPQAKIRTRVKNFLFKFPQVRAKLPRAELQALGVKPGPAFEKILERVFLDQLDGKIRTPQQLTKALRALAGIKEAASRVPSSAAGARRPKKR
jgi:tRNA nucleotidyltransferase (CCA-adding enzyme)